MLLAKDKDAMAQKCATRFDFDKAAGSYDRWYDSARGAMYDRLEKKAFDRLLVGDNQGKSLLEIGCGTGHWSKYFSEKGFEVTGIDISEGMINIAKKKNIPNSHFQIANGQSLPFADDSFDVAAAITTIEFTENPEKMLSEMVRCVNSPGTLLFGVLNALSTYNQRKKRQQGSIYAWSNLFSSQQLQKLLKPLGKVRLQIAGFIPKSDWLIPLSPLLEFIAQLTGSKRGAFIAAEVRL